MNFADECRRRALVLMEIAKEAPDFEAQLIFAAEQWLTLATIEELVRSGAGLRSEPQSFH